MRVIFRLQIGQFGFLLPKLVIMRAVDGAVQALRHIIHGLGDGLKSRLNELALDGRGHVIVGNAQQSLANGIDFSGNDPERQQIQKERDNGKEQNQQQNLQGEPIDIAVHFLFKNRINQK